jgi:polyhydroxyalkanoate synthase subunit PhaC
LNNIMAAAQTGSGSGQLVALTAGSTDLAPAADPPPALPIRAGRSASAGMHSGRREDHDSYSVTAFADITDRSLHAATARFTAGVSPAALAQAYSDWAVHLTFAPGKRMQLIDKAIRKAVRFGSYLQRCGAGGEHTEQCIEPLPQDHRFVDEAWRK